MTNELNPIKQSTPDGTRLFIEGAHHRYLAEVQAQNERTAKAESLHLGQEVKADEYGVPKLPRDFGVDGAMNYIRQAWPEVGAKFKTKKIMRDALMSGEFVKGEGKFSVGYDAGRRTPSGEGRRDIRYDKWDRSEIDQWAANQVDRHH